MKKKKITQIVVPILILAIIVSLIYSKRIVNKLSLLNKKMNDSDNLINDIIKNKTSVN